MNSIDRVKLISSSAISSIEHGKSINGADWLNLDNAPLGPSVAVPTPLARVYTSRKR